MREDPPCPRAWCGTGDKVCYHPWRGEVDGRKGESEGERPRPKNPIGFRNCDPTHAFPPASIRPCRVTWEGGKGRGDCFWGLFDLSPPLTPFLGLNVFPNPFPSPSPRFVPGFLAFLPPSLREHEFSHLTPSPPRSTSGETEDRNARTISVSQGRGWVARASTNYKGLPGFACVDTRDHRHPPLPLSPHTHTHLLTHSLTHSLSHSLSLSLSLTLS
ncbi:hypothetical protein IE53DRAFT_272759 [Violaceomyces palustris]|uniref:Uncharacterized protein n=1 Tax=Violaceomyces palustris TaxID=1673888 RepID=A0ACD0NMN4_9BASI|nr:hypothetical protein IE53DRAFT_272759 [Violaceomyces palustris]